MLSNVNEITVILIINNIVTCIPWGYINKTPKVLTHIKTHIEIKINGRSKILFLFSIKNIEKIKIIINNCQIKMLNIK